jgi:hypothetical protein
VTLILPLGDSKPTAEQVTNLFVFIQHSDGTKELIKGEPVPYDASGKDQSTSKAYKDVPANHWASAAIAKVSRNGLMKGSSEGNFDPDRTITRAEMAMIALRLKTASASKDAAFKDIAGHWAEVSIQQAKAAGYMNGYADGTFRPDQTLTRAEAVMILNRLLGREPITTVAGKWSDVSERYWAYGAIQAATVDHTSEK